MRPLSAKTELLLLVRASVAIVVVVWIYVASNTTDGSATSPRSLLPYQKLIADRSPVDQRMFRELQEGLLEAEAVRASIKIWPTPEALAGDGIPPFAADPTKRASYDWTMSRGGMIINYLGVPKSAEQPAWLVLIQEPEPGVPPDQTYEDEEHHRLVNGPMLHVSTWTRAQSGRVEVKLVRLPQAEGWTQLYAMGPSAKARSVQSAR